MMRYSVDITKNVEKRFDTSNYELERPMSKGKNKKVIGLMKDDLGGKRVNLCLFLKLWVKFT